MEDGVYYIHCDRPGCNNTIGAQRYENGMVVEEEWVPGVEITEQGCTYCNECSSERDTFKPLEDLIEGEMEDVSFD